MEKDNWVGEASDSEGESGVHDERAIPEKRALESDADRQEPLCKSEYNINVLVVCMCVCVCVSVCLSVCLSVCICVACCVCQETVFSDRES